jgi:pimeloyl-ACP methyl ester carboxylesterase
MNDEDYQLNICYRRYQTTKVVDDPINMVFLHGVGMNKGVWHYYIDLLYKKYSRLNACIAVDAVNHGDSAQANVGKLGYFSHWIDGSRDVCQCLKNEESFMKQNAVNIIVGHSMGGAVSLVTSLLEPNLFNSVVVVNPVSWTGDSFRKGLGNSIKRWLTTSQIKTDFTIQTDDWLQEITDYLKAESLFKYFDDTILNNLICDEYDGIYDPQKRYNVVNLKTKKLNQICSYASTFDSLDTAMPLYDKVKTPVYFVHSENDIQKEEACDFMETALENVLTRINIPGAFHLVNGDSPQIMFPIFESIFDEIIKKNTSRAIKDFDLKNEHGPNYKKALLETFLGEIVASDLKGKL